MAFSRPAFADRRLENLKTPLPIASARFLQPMQARNITELPEGEKLLYEVKWDGYRAIAIKNGERVEIRSRNNKDLTAAYPSAAAAVRKLKRTPQSSIAKSSLSIPSAGHRSRHYSIVQHARTIRSPTTPSTCCTLMVRTSHGNRSSSGARSYRAY